MRYNLNSNLIILGIIGLLFLILKALYLFANNSNLDFLLAPTNSLVELTLGFKAKFSAENGCFFEGLNIVIEKSCSGFNFLLVLFASLSVISTLKINMLKTKLITLAALIPICYCLTILVNASRIITAVSIQRMWPQSSSYSWLHQTEGTIIYLTFLFLIHLLFNYLLIKKRISNANPA